MADSPIPPRHRRRSAGGSAGQTAVEFALVAPLMITILGGIIAGCLLYFQNEAVLDGARGGARWASIETSLYTANTDPVCEGGTPDTIISAVKRSGNIVPVNPNHLCAPWISGVLSTTQLQSTPADSTKANIVVEANPTLADPQCVTVTVTYTTPSLPGPFPAVFTLQGHSGIPVKAGSSTACPGIGSPK